MTWRLGLKLVLNIQQYDYLEELSDAAGARILIHQSRTLPFPEDEGILVGPGKATSVGIKMVCNGKRVNIVKYK